MAPTPPGPAATSEVPDSEMAPLDRLNRIGWVADGISFQEGLDYSVLSEMEPDLLAEILNHGWVQDEVSDAERSFMLGTWWLWQVGGAFAEAAVAFLAMPFTESIDDADANLVNVLFALAAHGDAESRERDTAVFKVIVSQPHLVDGDIRDSDTLGLTFQATTYLVGDILRGERVLVENFATSRRKVTLPASGSITIQGASAEPPRVLDSQMDNLENALSAFDELMHGVPSGDPITIILGDDFAFGGSTHIAIDPSWDENRFMERISEDYWNGPRLHSSGNGEPPIYWISHGARAITAQLVQGKSAGDTKHVWTSPDSPSRTFEPTLEDCARYDFPYGWRCEQVVGVGLFFETLPVVGRDSFVAGLRLLREESFEPQRPGEQVLRNLQLCDYVRIFAEGADDRSTSEVLRVITKWAGSLPDCE